VFADKWESLYKKDLKLVINSLDTLAKVAVDCFKG